MLAGASENEIALVAFLLVLVLLATKIARIGEAIGGLVAARTPGGDVVVEEAPQDQEDQDDRQES